GVQGVMRDAILQLASEASVPEVTESSETLLSADDLRAADAVFICNSVRGIIPVADWYCESGKLICQWDSARHSAVIALMNRLHPGAKLPVADKA
ncbi:MAG: aminotransferase class IV, partial [Oceanospirillum sp.]|nr:aminotransferase class IV [Oceanospirillum sp.]